MCEYKKSSLPSFTGPASNDLDVRVFKTSIDSEEDMAKVKYLLDSLSNIIDWSVDRSDCDKVLRVTGRNLETTQIIEMIRAKGFNCEVLL